MLDKTSSIICAFGLASAVPRSPYRHLELCGIALSLRHIYRDFYANLLTRDQAHREKTEALQQYRLYAEMLDDTRRLCHTFVTITNDTEPLRRAYHLARRKGAPPEELLALACQIIRTATGDKTF